MVLKFQEIKMPDVPAHSAQRVLVPTHFHVVLNGGVFFTVVSMPYSLGEFQISLEQIL